MRSIHAIAMRNLRRLPFGCRALVGKLRRGWSRNAPSGGASSEAKIRCHGSSRNLASFGNLALNESVNFALKRNSLLRR